MGKERTGDSERRVSLLEFAFPRLTESLHLHGGD